MDEGGGGVGGGPFSAAIGRALGGEERRGKGKDRGLESARGGTQLVCHRGGDVVLVRVIDEAWRRGERRGRCGNADVILARRRRPIPSDVGIGYGHEPIGATIVGDAADGEMQGCVLGPCRDDGERAPLAERDAGLARGEWTSTCGTKYCLLTRLLADSLTGWLAGWLADWLAGWLAD